MSQPKPVTIRAHLLLLVLIVLLPAAVAAVWIIDRTYRAEQQLVERNLRDTSRALAMVVDAELSKRSAVASVLADSYLLDNGAEISADELLRFEQEARRAIGTRGGWVELLAGGRVLLDTRLPAGQRPAPSHRPTGIADARVERDDPLLAPLAPAGEDGPLVATIVQPVRRDGRTVLELRVTIVPQELQRIIDRHALPPDWLATILDSRGTLVARTPGGTSYAGRQASPDMLSILLNHSEGVFRSVSLDGMPTVGYFSTSRQGWMYLIAMPRNDLSLGVPLAVRNVAIGALALLALALAAALWVARRIVRPIVGLKDAAARMQAGDGVERAATGIAECDDVSAAMADASASLQRARTDLERQVAAAVARTRAAEQRASQSRRVEALGRLTGGVAHDFNNVLGIISNSVHLMQRQSGTPALAAPLAAALRAVEVGSRLTQYLLRFAGRQPVRPTAVDLDRYLLEAQEMINIVLGKRIALALDIERPLPNVTVDTSELELALINLALNARDALPAGGRVRLQARVADAAETASLPAGRYVAIVFADTGEGIDAEAIEHVFEPFFTTKAAGKGTGLGLSQVHGFCAQAGGTALVSSTPGAGTTVLLVLPAAAAAAAPAQPPPAPVDASGVAGKRLLLVEDNADLGETTAALLRSFGFQVAHALSARRALAMVDAGPGFDVVLSDVLMPGELDGLAMARLLRARWPGLPVVLISGYSSALTQARDFVVLHKPCAPDELLGALQRAIAAS